MNCVKCGKKINGSEMFCKVCGTNNKVTTDIVNSAIDGNKESLSFLYKLTYKDMYKTVKFAGCPKDSINEVMKDSYQDLAIPIDFLLGLTRLQFTVQSTS